MKTMIFANPFLWEKNLEEGAVNAVQKTCWGFQDLCQRENKFNFQDAQCVGKEARLGGSLRDFWGRMEEFIEITTDFH